MGAVVLAGLAALGFLVLLPLLLLGALIRGLVSLALRPMRLATGAVGFALGLAGLIVGIVLAAVGILIAIILVGIFVLPPLLLVGLFVAGLWIVVRLASPRPAPR